MPLPGDPAFAAGETTPFLHAYGSAGTQIEGQDFFAYWLKARRFGLGVGLEDFSLTEAQIEAVYADYIETYRAYL